MTIGVYCATCGCKTLPLDTTGCCAWCDTQLVEPVPGASLLSVAFCDFCGESFEYGCVNGGIERRFCSDKCRKSHWHHRTDAGQVWRLEYRRRANEKRRAAAAARRLSVQVFDRPAAPNLPGSRAAGQERTVQHGNG